MNKIIGICMLLSLLSMVAMAQNDLVVGSSYPLNVQNKGILNDVFLLHNAKYNSGTDLLQYETAHPSFGMRGIRFSQTQGIYFYASTNATTAAATFTPPTRFYIGNDGNIGIGITAPSARLHLSGGNLVIDNSTVPSIATGVGTTELSRYLRIINSPNLATPSGLKAGGVVVADDFTYANPAKNDLIIKGKVSIGQTSTTSTNGYSLLVNGTVHAKGLYVNDQIFVSSQWKASSTNLYYTGGSVGIGTPLTANPNAYLLAVNGKVGAKDFQVEKTSTTWPDYVFEENYPLPPLMEVEKFVQASKHLKDVPSVQEVNANGYSVSAMDAVLLKKIEELTLYIIQQQKEIEQLKSKLK